MKKRDLRAMLSKAYLAFMRASYPKRSLFSGRRPVFKAHDEFEPGPILVDGADFDVHDACRETRIANAVPCDIGTRGARSSSANKSIKLFRAPSRKAYQAELRRDFADPAQIVAGCCRLRRLSMEQALLRAGAARGSQRNLSVPRSSRRACFPGFRAFSEGVSPNSLQPSLRRACDHPYGESPGR